ncbi:hypothetical protein [Cloacibacillus porcorum]
MRLRRGFAALFAALTVMTAGAAFAHPPTDVNAVWNKDNGTLTVTAAHQVNDRTKHYVMTLVVKEGSKQLQMKKYTEQQSNEGFSNTIPLSGVKPGTQLTVELTCNIMGTSEKTITVQ